MKTIASYCIILCHNYVISYSLSLLVDFYCKTQPFISRNTQCAFNATIFNVLFAVVKMDYRSVQSLCRKGIFVLSKIYRIYSRNTGGIILHKYNDVIDVKPNYLSTHYRVIMFHCKFFVLAFGMNESLRVLKNE